MGEQPLSSMTYTPKDIAEGAAYDETQDSPVAACIAAAGVRRRPEACAHAQKRSARTTAYYPQPERVVCTRQCRSRRTDGGTGQLERWQGKPFGRAVGQPFDLLEFRRAGKVQRRAASEIQRKQRRHFQLRCQAVDCCRQTTG